MAERSCAPARLSSCLRFGGQGCHCRLPIKGQQQRWRVEPIERYAGSASFAPWSREPGFGVRGEQAMPLLVGLLAICIACISSHNTAPAVVEAGLATCASRLQSCAMSPRRTGSLLEVRKPGCPAKNRQSRLRPPSRLVAERHADRVREVQIGQDRAAGWLEVQDGPLCTKLPAEG